MNKEFIICAAIWVNDKKYHEAQPKNIESGFIICGRRHYQTIIDLKGPVNQSLNISDDDLKKHQGFLTSLDRRLENSKIK